MRFPIKEVNNLLIGYWFQVSHSPLETLTTVKNKLTHIKRKSFNDIKLNQLKTFKLSIFEARTQFSKNIRHLTFYLTAGLFQTFRFIKRHFNQPFFGHFTFLLVHFAALV